MEGWIAFSAALLINAAVYGLLALGLNLHYGYAGLLNFGHVAFFAAGAFASALATLPPPGSPAYAGAYQIGFGLPVAVGFLLAGAAGGLLALLIGVASVRLGGHYLAIATFALAEIFVIFLGNEVWLTRGHFGISSVPRPFASLVGGTGHLVALLGLSVAVLALALLLMQRATAGPFGRVLRGVREDEVAARSLGKPAPQLKLKAFVVGGVLAGVAGALWVHTIGAVHVGQFVPIVTFNVWLAVLLGGVGNNVGVLFGAVLLVAIREGTRFLGAVPLVADLAARRPTLLPSLRFVIIGLLLVLVVRFAPQGVIPERLRTRGQGPAPLDAPGADEEPSIEVIA